MVSHITVCHIKKHLQSISRIWTCRTPLWSWCRVRGHNVKQGIRYYKLLCEALSRSKITHLDDLQIDRVDTETLETSADASDCQKTHDAADSLISHCSDDASDHTKMPQTSDDASVQRTLFKILHLQTVIQVIPTVHTVMLHGYQNNGQFCELSRPQIILRRWWTRQRLYHHHWLEEWRHGWTPSSKWLIFA